VHLADFMLTLLTIFFMVIYFMMVFRIISDMFRDTSLGGGAKVLWLLAILFFPLVAMLVYVIARGKGMAERDLEQFEKMRSAQAEYVKGLVVQSGGASAADQISQAKALLDNGTISAEEFQKLKAKALG
jgi:ABC-type multidrug transport system fused ATPase/permease subunit